MAYKRRDVERAQDAVSSAIASLELGVPEHITRANARADGATTPMTQ